MASHAPRKAGDSAPRRLSDRGQVGWQSALARISLPVMHMVYLLRSRREPSQTYIGLTDDLDGRLKGHNEGESPHTSRYRPWDVVCFAAFASREKAADFERYLKHGSGHAFARRHLW